MNFHVRYSEFRTKTARQSKKREVCFFFDFRKSESILTLRFCLALDDATATGVVPPPLPPPSGKNKTALSTEDTLPLHTHRFLRHSALNLMRSALNLMPVTLG